MLLNMIGTDRDGILRYLLSEEANSRNMTVQKIKEQNLKEMSIKQRQNSERRTRNW